MLRRLSLPFKLKPLFITGVVLLSFVASAATSLLPTSTVSAKAGTYAAETDLSTVMKAIKYINAIAYCVDSNGPGGFKTTIAGDTISNGPRWWVYDSPLAATLTIGKQLDQWGDKNGIAKCNGETDSEPGWINDALTFFGINVRNSDKGNRDKSLEELGYKCTKSGTDISCENDNANADSSTKGSILYILRNLPYLHGANLVNLTATDPKIMAASYYAAMSDYTTLCKATADGGTSNLTNIWVVDKGTITKQQWGGGKSSIDAGLGEVALTANNPGDGNGWIGSNSIENGCTNIANYLNKDYATAYLKFITTSACSTQFTDSAQAAACVEGSNHLTDLGYCTTHYQTGYQGSTLVNKVPERLACYIGQGNQGEEDCVVKLKYDLNAPPDASTNPTGISNQLLLQACIKGAQNSDTTFCATQYGDAYQGSTLVNNAALRLACVDGQKYPAAGGLTTGSAICVPGSTAAACVVKADTKTSCVVDGIGWLVCPLMNALGGLNDAMYGWVQSVLVLNPLTQTDSSGTATPQYQNWSNIRNIANVMLVIGFLAIIFSQISSIGISNYGVKKMLPRIIMIAIAINLSWTIMTLSVDVVNIIGVGLHSLLDATAVNATADNLNTASTVNALLTGAGTLAVGGITAIIALPAAEIGLGTLVLLALPFILGAALALFAAVATLFVRNALIIVLVIISPVAIAAALLPNTEQYFKSWRKMFIQMLMLFPMAALLFAGCKFAAYVVLTSNQPMAIIAALFIMAAPLGMLPWLARSSGGIMAAVGGRLQGIAKSSQGALKRGLQPRVDASKSTYGSGKKNWWGVTRGKLTPALNPDGTPKMRNGKPVTYRAMPVGKNGKPKTTMGQKWANSGQRVAQRDKNNKRVIIENWKQIGLNGEGRGARKTRSLLDEEQTIGLQEKSTSAQYSARLEERQLNASTPEHLITKNLEDAEATSKGFQGRLKQEQAERIRDGAGNTVAGSIGAEGILNLRDVSQQAYVAEAGAAAAEAENTELNINSKAADDFIQIEHEAKEGIKVRETEQEADFKEHQNERARQNTLDRETDSTVELDNTLKQNAQDRRVETNEAEIKERQETVAHSDEELEALEERKQKAEEGVTTLHTAEEAKLAARRSPTGGPLDADGNPTAGDLYGLTRQQEESKLEKETSEAEQKKAFGDRLGEADTSRGGLQELAERKAALEEAAAGGSARAKARIDAAKAGIRDPVTGELKEIPGMDEDVREQLAQAGREQAIAARNSSLAGGIAEVVRGKEVNYEPDGELARDMAGIDLGLSPNTNLEAANAARVTEADLEADRKAYDDLHKRRGLSSTQLYSDVLGVPDPAGVITIRSSDDMPLAEELSAVGQIIQFGGADDQDNLFNYSSELTRAAIQAEKDSANVQADSTASEEAKKKARDDAAAARFRSKTIHSAMQRGWAQFGGQRPMQYGGSVEQTLAQDTETRTKNQIQADRLGGGKYDHTVGTQNIDRINALRRQIKSYETNPGQLTTDFTEAYRVGAEYTATQVEGIPSGTPAWNTRVAELIAKKVTAAPDNLAMFVTQLDKALDDPRSPALSPEKRAALTDTRESLLTVLDTAGISRPEVPMVDPTSQKQLFNPDGSMQMGPYRRRTPSEYNPQG